MRHLNILRNTLRENFGGSGNIARQNTTLLRERYNPVSGNRTNQELGEWLDFTHFSYWYPDRRLKMSLCGKLGKLDS
jgi:hypothetical protein